MRESTPFISNCNDPNNYIFILLLNTEYKLDFV